MAKNVASLKSIVREIAKTEAKLEKARKAADVRGRKILDLKIRQLNIIKKDVKLLCKNSFNITV